MVLKISRKYILQVGQVYTQSCTDKEEDPVKANFSRARKEENVYFTLAMAYFNTKLGLTISEILHVEKVWTRIDKY